jgi:hypothetical protein
MKKHLIFALLFFQSIGYAEIYEIQALDFGTIAVIDNSSAASMTIDKFGNTTVSAHLRIVSPPIPGHFLINDLPPSTGISINMSHNSNTMTPLSSSQEFFTFSLTDYTDYLVTDVNGEAELLIGGTITTSGSGSLNFAQTDYRINYRVIFLY